MLAVQSEKKSLIETFKILRIIPLQHRSAHYDTEYSCIVGHLLLLKNSSEEQSEEFLWATRPGSLHFQPATLMQDAISSRVDSTKYLFDAKFKALIPHIFPW